MNKETLSLCPKTFFSLELNCLAVHTKLTKDHKILDPCVSPDVELSLGWGQEGLWVQVVVEPPFNRSSIPPQFDSGDCVMLCIDTRDLKSARSIHPFCHHFFFLPDGTAGECTRLRTSDARPLCDPADLSLTTTFNKHIRRLNIFIPAHCLYGFDPRQFPRLGFACIVHRRNRPAYSFTASIQDLAVDMHPELWASLTLTP